MSFGNRLIALALLLFAVSIVGAAKAARYEAPAHVGRNDDRRGAELPASAFGFGEARRSAPGARRQLGPAGLPARQADVSRDYAGSDACQRCHDAEHAQWQRSIHIKMTKPVADAVITGDFHDASFAAHGRAYKLQTRDGRRYVSVSHGGRPFQSFEVHYTLGAKRFQGYLSRLPDGRLYVLPAFWHVAQRRWVDWKEITPVPDGAHDLRQIWNVTCFNCHATNLDAKFDIASKRYDTSWTEMGLGCETCHGPGRPHIALMDEWRKNPAGVPAYDKRAGNRGLGPLLRIFSPRTADPRQVFDTCAYCHGNKNNMFLGFLPGTRMEDFALPFLVSQPMPAGDPQGDFWPDGRPSRFNRPQALTLTGCFMTGNATCTNCHVAHGSRQEHSLKVSIAESDRLCTQCHESLAQPAAAEKHTYHPAASQGSRCIECHMSDVNWRLLIRRRDHTFAAPVPEMTAKYGAPNACTTCHDTRSPEWAAQTMNRWWGDGERRAGAMRVADAFALAGAGDAAALPALATLATDRSRGMLVRASAAEFIGQVMVAAAGNASRLTRTGPSQTSTEGAPGAATEVAAYSGRRSAITDGRRPELQFRQVAPEIVTRVVNALIGAANDPEPAVRAVAVRSLGAIGDRRALMPMVARLGDEVRAVRASAAEGLLWMGVSALPGAAGERLVRAQDEYGTSLDVFPEVVSNHASRGWLESERGRQAEAARALDTAIGLDPQYARAHVYRGVVSARTGLYGEAIRHWERAKSIDPGYPNLDRLIDEARRQSGVR